MTLDPTAARVVPWTQLRKWLAHRPNNFPLQHGICRQHTDTPITKDDCHIAHWVRHRRPTSWAAERQPPDALASGENTKKGRRRKLAFSPGFFRIFILPVGTHPFVPQASRGLCFFVRSPTSRVGCRDDVPARGREAPCFAHSCMRSKVISPSCTAMCTVSPRWMCPAMSFSLRASSTVRWIMRRRGRAPYCSS